MLGHPCDSATWQSAAVETPLENGVHPTWNEKTTFTIKVPELAILEFKVHQVLHVFLSSASRFPISKVKRRLEGPDQLLGCFSAAVPMLKKGYRNILLQVILMSK